MSTEHDDMRDNLQFVAHHLYIYAKDRQRIREKCAAFTSPLSESERLKALVDILEEATCDLIDTGVNKYGNEFACELMSPATAPATRSTAARTIKAALAAAVSPLPDQTPAVECAIILHGMATSLVGSLSETPEGGLRLLSPIGKTRGEIEMVEQFFDYADVLVFGQRRIVRAESGSEPGSIFIPS